MLFEVLPDIELAMYGYQSRTRGAVTGWPADGRSSTPQTCPIFGGRIVRDILGRERLKVVGKRTIKLPSAWQGFLRAIQPTPKAYQYIIKKGQGWFNQEFPFCETLAMGSGLLLGRRNVVSGEPYNEQWIKVSTFDVTKPPPDPKVYNVEKHPELIHWFNVVGPRGQVYDGRPGGVVIFLISDMDMFIPTARVRRA